MKIPEYPKDKRCSCGGVIIFDAMYTKKFFCLICGKNAEKSIEEELFLDETTKNIFDIFCKANEPHL